MATHWDVKTYMHLSVEGCLRFKVRLCKLSYINIKQVTWRCYCFRLCLAALHYNENANKVQQVDEAGNPKFSTIFPKAKKGDYSLQKRREYATYGK